MHLMTKILQQARKRLLLPVFLAFLLFIINEAVRCKRYLTAHIAFTKYIAVIARLAKTIDLLCATNYKCIATLFNSFVTN